MLLIETVNLEEKNKNNLFNLRVKFRVLFRNEFEKKNLNSLNMHEQR